MKADMLVTADYQYPRERVWAALTSSAALAEWFMPNDFEPEVGRSFTFRTEPAPGFDGIVHCRVLELEPPERMVWWWAGGQIEAMRLGVIELVSVPVTDQARSKEFYEDKLGFKVISDDQFGDQRWVQLEPPGGGVNITLVTWFEEMRPGSLKGLVISCDDVDGTVGELRDRGVQLGGPPEDMAWGRFASVQDPGGNTLLLRQAPAA